ncbi:helix-turn-helix domain-containing protein [Erythrobacter sp. BLCC-B19]|uniref:helix-turn-helix domain-containing protein n=1 Tax=Erythrobacter sp. BLCC-B19 TaxID=3025315 RepID=UPI00235F2106|nr:helix-turn-helix domain-containing protein [Erythrobacter sp. BLCC-B19]WDA41670.1 helix-turn-helix domain-containing protein [Erythrobacter sp. BLCC-B19]
MDSENTTSGDTAHDTSLADGPGARLRAARQALRLDLAHVAAETRIPLRHLEAIEGDNYEALPSRAYAIGFSRTFAKAVGLDPAEITDMVRAELADGSLRRALPSPGIEPGDPARLPSSGLAWAMGGAVLVLALGVFAFYRAYFGAGTEPGSLLEPAASATPAAVAAKPAAATTPAASGPVVLTALEEGVWLRLYEEGGERLFERALKLGEAVTVPATAADPRINTGRPDALSVTIGGQAVAKLSDKPETISGVPVSAAALLARGTTPAAMASGVPMPGGVVPLSAPAPAPARRRSTVPRPAPTTITVPEAAPASEPAPAAEAAPAPQG